MYSNLEKPFNDDHGLPPLRESLGMAQAIAREQSRRVLLSRTVIRDRRAPEPNPEPFERYVVWEQAERGFALMALGLAQTPTSTGPGRFEDVRVQLDRLLEGALLEHEEGAPHDLPLAIAGFSFDPENTAGAKWDAFPDALAMVPRLLYTSIGNDRYLTTNVVVDAMTDIDAVVTELAVDFRRAITMKLNVTLSRPDLREIEPNARAAWYANVESLTGHIERGEAEKVVLARRYTVEAGCPISVSDTLDRLRGRFPGCTVFAVRNGDTCFLGATPEMLVRMRNGVVSADCLAGSIRRGEDESSDVALGLVLLADDKERREHQMVVRGLVDSLSDVCEDIDVPETPSIKRMANVQHLHSPLRARMRDAGHVLDLVERLHPTPAVGGLPRERAVCLIRRHENFDRGWYAGPIGWIDAQGGGEFAVALRSALVQGKRASLYAGCGIVRGSDPDREYEESKLKLSAVLSALGTLPEDAQSDVTVPDTTQRVSIWRAQ